MRAGGRAVALDEIEAAVAVAVELAPDENAVGIDFLEIRPAVEVDVGLNPDDPAGAVRGTPHVRPAVAVAILDANVEGGEPRRDRRRADQRERNETPNAPRGG